MHIPGKIKLLRWGERLLAMLVLALLALLGWRFFHRAEPPADAPAGVVEFKLGELSPTETRRGEYSIPFTWSLNPPLNNACVINADVSELPEFEEKLDIIVGSKELSVEFAPAPQLSDDIRPVFSAKLIRSFERRRPSGKRHMIRHILLICKLPAPADEQHRYILQQIELDAALGTAELVPCIPFAAASVQHHHSLEPSGLPELYGSAPIPRDMRRIVYALAAVDSPELAQTAAEELLVFADRLARKAPAPGTPWPHNWGEYAEDARAAAAQLVPTLVYLQDNDCFDSGDLAAFINSTIFSVIFGQRFHTLPAERLQDDIEYTPISEDEL